MYKEQITLIGRGYLGDAVAKHFASSFDVLCTTTTPEKPGIVFDVKKDELPESLKESDLFIYTVPPLPLTLIRSFFLKLSPKARLVFISSTSVYGKNQGLVTEETLPKPESENGLILVETEEFIRSQFTNACILRPGGLYGRERHPLYYLQGKTNLKNGDEFLHLAHRDDCVSAIAAIIEKNSWGQTFNIVSDLKSKKADYYPAMAKKLNLIEPVYENLSLPNPTQISSEKSKKILGLNYIDPRTFLPLK